MKKPNFSIVAIMKDEAKTLPRLLKSLEEFKARGGEFCILDTGSTDDSVKIAREWGCKIKEVGTKYVHIIDADYAVKINERFVVEGEEPIIKAGDKYFDFASARNAAAEMASNNWVSCADCDEEFTALDIDKINEIIDNKELGNCDYQFVFSHDAYGREAIKFLQCKMYNKTKMRWIGRVHENVTGIGTRQYLDESILKLEHWQNFSTNRHSYLIGLATDCFDHQELDRNSHYFARECMWAGRPKSAIKEFKRHIAFNAWPEEAAQSMIYIGDCFGQLNQPEEQCLWYHKAFHHCPTRREALIKLAQFYQWNKKWQPAICYAKAALEIPWGAFYSNKRDHYENLPHEILYVSYGWTGRIAEAQEHILKALEYQPLNPIYLRDTKFYFPYGDPGIEGWMKFDELLFLYEVGKKYKKVCEVGSFAGRSTHALLTGGADVTAIDHFNGSVGEKAHEGVDKDDALYKKFLANVGHFKNLTINRKSSLDAAKDYKNSSFDAIFLDAGHSFEECRDDIRAWKSKVKIVLMGHDFCDAWAGVKRAVTEELGGPDEVHGSVWVKYMVPPESIPPTNFDAIDDERKKLLEMFTANIKYSNNFNFVKLGDGEILCMTGANGGNCDGHPYSPELGTKLEEAFTYFGNSKHTYIGDCDRELGVKNLENSILKKLDIQPKFIYVNLLLHRKGELSKELWEFYNTIRESERKKVFVGPERLGIVAKLLRAKHIVVPRINAFGNYEDILTQVQDEIERDAIFMFSCGMPAKALMHKVSARTKDSTTCLDIGSSWDPLCCLTRTNQVSKKEMEEFYKTWL